MRLRCVSLAMQRAADPALLNFTRRLGILRGIAISAPLVGMLGTSVGIVESFRGTAGPSSVWFREWAGFLSVTIVPTLVGIFLGVVNDWAYRCFLSQVDSFRTELLKAEDQVLCYLRTRT